MAEAADTEADAKAEAEAEAKAEAAEAEAAAAHVTAHNTKRIGSMLSRHVRSVVAILNHFYSARSSGKTFLRRRAAGNNNNNNNKQYAAVYPRCVRRRKEGRKEKNKTNIDQCGKFAAPELVVGMRLL